MLKDLGFKVYGVSWTRRADAESARARSVNRMIPSPLALHPHLDLCGFRVSLISDCALVFLFVMAPVWTRRVQGFGRVWLEAFTFLQ